MLFYDRMLLSIDVTVIVSDRAQHSFARARHSFEFEFLVQMLLALYDNLWSLVRVSLLLLMLSGHIPYLHTPISVTPAQLKSLAKL